MRFQIMLARLSRLAPSNPREKAWLTLFIMLLAPGPLLDAGGYNFQGGNNVDANGGLRRWISLPIVYRFNSGVSDALPSIVDGSDPRGAINAAFDVWASESAVTFSVGPDSDVTDAGLNDGINLITFADTPGNAAAVGSAIVLNLGWFDIETNQILDKDIVFNPNLSRPFTTRGDPGAFDLQYSTLRMAGLFIGLTTSPVISSTQYPFILANGQTGSTLESRNQRSISHDDRAGANRLFPLPPFSTGAMGAIAGIVGLGGVGVYGAHVVATHNENGIVYGANITLGQNQGARFSRYEIQGLPPGQYTVTAEPLDGPLTDLFYPGDFAGGDFWGGTFTTGYLTTEATESAQVTAGGVATVDIALIPGTPALNPEYIGPVIDGLFFGAVKNSFEIKRGATERIVVTGLGMNTVLDAGIRCSDPNITVDPSSVIRAVLEDLTPVVAFDLTVAPNAEAGARNLIFSNGQEIAIYAGGLYVDGLETRFPGATPTPIPDPSPSPVPTPALTIDFADEGNQDGWTVTTFGGATARALQGTQVAAGLCILSPLEGDNGGVWSSPRSAAIELVANSVYRVRFSMSADQNRGGFQPVWNLLIDNLDELGRLNWGAERWFFDNTAFANGIGNVGRDGLIQFDAWITPSAVTTDAWNGRVDPENSPFDPANIGSAAFNIKFRVLDIAPIPGAQTEDEGTICLRGLRVDRFDLDRLVSDGPPIWGSSTRVPDEVAVVSATAGALFEDAGDAIRIQLNESDDPDGPFGPLKGFGRAFVAFDDPLQNVLNARIYPIAWNDHELLRLTAEIRATGAEAVAPVDVIAMGWQTATNELGGTDFMFRGQPGGIMDRAGSPRPDSVAASTYTSFFYTHHATDISLVLLPEANRLRAALDLFNRTDLAGALGAGNLSDELEIRSMAVDRIDLTDPIFGGPPAE